MSLGELARRFLQPRTEESGSPLEWTASSGTLGSKTTLAVFSWCFFLEAELAVPAGGLPAGLVRITDALGESLEFRLVGQDGNELGSFRAATEESGVLFLRLQRKAHPREGVIGGPRRVYAPHSPRRVIFRPWADRSNRARTGRSVLIEPAGAPCAEGPVHACRQEDPYWSA